MEFVSTVLGVLHLLWMLVRLPFAHIATAFRGIFPSQKSVENVRIFVTVLTAFWLKPSVSLGSQRWDRSAQPERYA